MPQTSVQISETEALVNYVKNHDSIGYTTHVELDKIDNLDGVATVPLDDTYVLVLTRDLFSHEAFNNYLSTNELSQRYIRIRYFLL